MAKKEKPFYSKPWFWAIVIVAVIALWIVGSYNSFVSMNQAIDGQWAQVETQYQRRIDLIPNVVNSVKGYMQFEKSLLEEITTLRSQWMATSDVDNKVNIGNELDSALGRLIVVYENYPQLTSDTSLLQLIDELEGTENRIAVERMRFNENVRKYNTAVLMFPSNVLANMFGFSQRPYFESQEGADTAPVVDLTV
ncbi:MAG: LemA family protein [Candidatus Aenigmarchaeota archaeon]|nr:LemA family protein [Candidatus Aenigmarchaeota archaeon]